MLGLKKVPLGAGLTLVFLISASAYGDDEDTNQFRGDVLGCEEALAHLEECCPRFDAAPVLCDYEHSYRTGCGSPTTTDIRPALSRPESTCVREMSCEDLVAKQVCNRAQAARPYVTKRSHASSGQPGSTFQDDTHKPVCP
jgi:hypothetical protein